MTVALHDLTDGAPTIEPVIGGLADVYGPVFSRRGYLLFSDLQARRIMKWEDRQLTAYRTDSNGATGLSFDHDGRLLACEATRVTRTEKDEGITVLVPKLIAPADIVYSIDGSIYFTDRAAVYLISPKGTVRPTSQQYQRPHGIALSPNQRKIYISDAISQNVLVHDVLANGSLGEGRVFATVAGAPAGLKADELGDVWVAAASGIWVFDSNGNHLGTVAIPGSPTGCCWGEGFLDLYVTAGTSVFRISTKVTGTCTY